MDKEHAVKRITLIALMATLSMIIKIIFQALTTGAFRITFYEIPLIICGIAAGPLAGLTAGFVSDFVYASVYGYPLGLFTLSAMLWGFIAGIFLYKKTFTIKAIVIVIVIASLLEFIINSMGLFLLEYAGDFGIAFKTVLGGMTLRVLISILKWPVQIGLVYVVWNRIVETNLLHIEPKKR